MHDPNSFDNQNFNDPNYNNPHQFNQPNYNQFGDPSVMPQAKTSPLAIASLILGLCSLLCCFTSLPAIICGIIGIVQISGSQGRQKGIGLAIGGIVMSIVFPIIAILVSLMLPAIMGVKETAMRSQSMNNLRYIILAVHNYESANRKLPQDITDENGNPLLSWRVAILPYIEESALYSQFHLDEPWDSPHNKQLISSMPIIYLAPGSSRAEFKTAYLAVSGKEAVYGSDDEWNLGKITAADGSAFTIFAVEVDESEEVVWSKPSDYNLNLSDPQRGLGNRRAGGFLAAMFDGTTHFISNQITDEALNSYYTPDGRKWGQTYTPSPVDFDGE